MKRYVTFEIRKQADTTVVVRFDDRDYNVISATDMAKLAKFACDVVARDARSSRPDYDWLDEQIDIIGPLPKPHANPGNELAEDAPRPADWMERRLRRALEGYVDPLSDIGGAATVERVAELVFRRVIVSDAGTRLIVDGCELSFVDLIDANGELAVEKWSGSDDTQPTKHEAMNKAIAEAMRSALGLMWDDDEIIRRVYAAMDWDEKGRVRS